MKNILDKGFMILLMVFALIAIIISMIAGPFGHNSLSIGASVAACVFCIVVIGYGLHKMRKRRR